MLYIIELVYLENSIKQRISRNARIRTKSSGE